MKDFDSSVKKLPFHDNSVDYHSFSWVSHDSTKNLSSQWSGACVPSYLCSAPIFDGDVKYQPYMHKRIKLPNSHVNQASNINGWKKTDKQINTTMRRKREFVFRSDSLCVLFFSYGRLGITAGHYMRFCSAVSCNSKSKNLPHCFTTRRRIWPFVISKLFFQATIVSIPVSYAKHILQKRTERCSDVYENRNSRAVSRCSLVVPIKLSESEKYDVFTLSFLEVFENSSNVFDRHQFSNRTDMGHWLVVRVTQMRHQHINYLTFLYFDEDIYAGLGNGSRLKFKVLDKKIQYLNSS